MKRTTVEEFKNMYGANALDDFKNPTPQAPQEAPQEAGYLSRVGTAIKTGVQDVQKAVTVGAEKFNQGDTAGGIARSSVGVTGAVVRTALSPITEALSPLVAPLIAKTGLAESDVMKNLNDWAEANPETALNLKDTFDSIVGFGGAKVAVTGAKVGLPVARRVVGAGMDGLDSGAKALVPALKNAVDVVRPAVDVVRPAVDYVKNIPGRIGTNIEAVKVSEQAIRALPKIAQNTVRQGIDIEDVSSVLKTNVAQKPSLGKLWTATRDFVNKKSGNNPIEALGKPAVDRFNTLKVQTAKLGNELDDVAEGLVGKTVKGRDVIISNVDVSLAKLRIKKTDDGIDFVGSNLEGLGANEKIISNVYRRLTEATDANDLHRLKKYIDNNVDFGKTPGGLIGEAENLLKGWRKVIDGTLDLEFPAYNKVNTELALRLKPINDFKRVMGQITGLDEDLMNMSAGMLMTRIASNLRSNPILRQTLRDLDKATKVKGKLSLDIEGLVDFYSVLEKYYPEIIGKKTLKGNIMGALESGGIMDKVTGVAKSVAGQSEAVKRKAITEFLDDFFGTTS